MEDAACQGFSEAFDEDLITPEAFALCYSCPVRLDCYAWIMAQPRDHDYCIFGGLGRQQRLRIRDRRSTYNREFTRNLPLLEKALNG